MSQTTHTEDTIDLKELFFSLIAQWKLITICILLSLTAALLYLRTTPNTYSVNALVQVEESKGTSAALLGDLSGLMDQKSPGQTEVEILKSRLVLGQVIEKLNLDLKIQPADHSWFQKLINPQDFRLDYQSTRIDVYDNEQKIQIHKFIVPKAYLDTALELNIDNGKVQLIDVENDVTLLETGLNHAQPIQSTNGTWQIQISAPTNLERQYTVRKESLPAAVDSLMQQYSAAERGKMTGILGLNYQGTDKDHITKVLNEILLSYSEQNVARRSAETAQTLKFLDEELPRLSSDLDVAERAFNQFRQTYNTVDITKESELYLTQSVTLETQKITLEQQVADAAAKYTAEHPVMQQMTAQLSVIQNKIAELESKLKQLPDLQRRYLQLYREVEVKQQLYTALLNSYQQLKIAKAGEIGNVRIVDTAVEPVEPIKPKKLIVLALSLFVGGFIGVLLALVKNMLRSGIKDASQIENELDLPVYATVPRSPVQESRMKILKKKKVLPVLAIKNNDDIAIESLRSMRTAIHFTLRTAKNNIIMISGPAPEIGKSFISTNLAVILAQSQKRVLLIDADLRRGYLHKYFADNNTAGVSEHLNGQISLDSIIRHTEVEGLDIITRGKSPTNPSELLSAEDFATMLDALSAQYDHIIIDTPPVLAVTDAIIVSQYAGVNLIIARHGKTNMKELEITLNRFEQAGGKVNGIILNDVQRSAAGYGYGYGYNYSYAYKAHKD